LGVLQPLSYQPILTQVTYDKIDKALDEDLETIHRLRDLGFLVDYKVEFGSLQGEKYVFIEYTIRLGNKAKYVTKKIPISRDEIVWLGDEW